MKLDISDSGTSVLIACEELNMLAIGETLPKAFEAFYKELFDLYQALKLVDDRMLSEEGLEQKEKINALPKSFLSRERTK